MPKVKLEEIYYPETVDEKKAMRFKKIEIYIETWLRDAEKVAFNKVRKIARNLNCTIIRYLNWSGANPDFMNGDDEAKARAYRIEAHLYKI